MWMSAKFTEYVHAQTKKIIHHALQHVKIPMVHFNAPVLMATIIKIMSICVQVSKNETIKSIWSDLLAGSFLLVKKNVNCGI